MVAASSIEEQVEELVSVMHRLGRLGSLRDPVSSIAELDLAPAQIHALMWLGIEGELAMGTLAQRIGATLPATTRAVDRLKSLGYVLRERDHEDRRVVHARLSAKGRRLHEQFDESFREKLTFVLAALSDTDRGRLLEILERLADNLSTWAETHRTSESTA